MTFVLLNDFIVSIKQYQLGQISFARRPGLPQASGIRYPVSAMPLNAASPTHLQRRGENKTTFSHPDRKCDCTIN